MTDAMPHAATLALLQRYYDAFNGQDWAGMLDCLAEDVAHDLNQGVREIGRPAFAVFLARMATCYREQLEPVVVMASDDGSRGAAEYVVHGTYLADDEGLPPASGQQYRLPGGAFFAVENGRISRVSNYYNLEDWIDQVLPEDGY